MFIRISCRVRAPIVSALCLVGLVMAGLAPAPVQARRSYLPSKVLKEVVMSIDASAVRPPSREVLAKTALEEMARQWPCLTLQFDATQVNLACGGESAAADWPPTSGFQISRLLKKALQLVGADVKGPSHKVERVARALAASLNDPYTAYLSPAMVRNLKDKKQSDLANPAIELSPLNPSRIREVRPGSDSYRQGLRDGDRIVSVDGKTTKGLSYAELAAHLIGKDGSHIKLRIEHQDGRLITHNIRRSYLPEPLVDADVLKDDMLYLRISAFAPGVGDRVREEVWNHQVRGVVLDLRHNHGGQIDQGIQLLDLFFSDGKIGGVRPRKGRPPQDFVGTPEATDLKLPLVVIIDGASASASELVSMVLKERQRAVVIGSRSIGKGSVQELIKLPDDGLLRVTVADYIGPKGNRLARTGITPDKFLAPPKGQTVLEGGVPAKDPWVLVAVDILKAEGKLRESPISLYGPKP